MRLHALHDDERWKIMRNGFDLLLRRTGPQSTKAHVKTPPVLLRKGCITSSTALFLSLKQSRDCLEPPAARKDQPKATSISLERRTKSKKGKGKAFSRPFALPLFFFL